MADTVAVEDPRIHDEFCLAPKYKDIPCTCTDPGYPYLPDAEDALPDDLPEDHASTRAMRLAAPGPD